MTTLFIFWTSAAREIPLFHNLCFVRFISNCWYNVTFSLSPDRVPPEGDDITSMLGPGQVMPKPSLGMTLCFCFGSFYRNLLSGPVGNHFWGNWYPYLGFFTHSFRSRDSDWSNWHGGKCNMLTNISYFKFKVFFAQRMIALVGKRFLFRENYSWKSL